MVERGDHSCSNWGEQRHRLRGLQQFAIAGLRVVLTARDADRGQEAHQKLKHEGLQNISFHQLDVTDAVSRTCFASWLLREHGGFNILQDHGSKGFILWYGSAKACIETNYYGAKYITQALLPLARHSDQGARFINVGSVMGQLTNLRNAKLQRELACLECLSEAVIEGMLDKYLNDVKQHAWGDKSWPLKFSCYKMSKIALHAYTRLLATQLEKGFPDKMIFVNCVDLGPMRTDITAGMGKLSPSEGAKNISEVVFSRKWWNEETVAVVTGRNKGIGFEVCKQFAIAGLRVVLTARDADRGQEAHQKLKHEGFQNICFHQLDVTDAVSHLQEGLFCFETNYYGAKYITQALLPLARHSDQGARIINVGSVMGQLTNLRNAKLQRECLSEAVIEGMLDKYLNDVKQHAWGDNKIALHAYTRLLATELEKGFPDKMIFLNCVDPGPVRTDITAGMGKLSPSEGAENIVWVALLPCEECRSGKFFSVKKLAKY
ncbi:hypothetical protein KP509_24G010500 [Ceratopteris richardii]|uniref:Uncharacterized protein n=1 Tax=Ceratopteris richardii TaxID=49495 RepID=A0A8T2RUW3_CERRI|nr:hypothetical protein KP509_24G010500 [Ceratopteris richardii]